MSNLKVVYDACVLYSAPLRDLLMELALTGLFRARWTNEIHDEWMRNVLKQRPDLTRKQLERTKNLMNAHGLDCLVEGYDHLISTLMLPDEHDRHVLAAAIKSSASLIITYNLKDFPMSQTKKHGIKAIHPDDFVTQVFLTNPKKVNETLLKHRHSLKNPPVIEGDYLKTLERQQLKKFITLITR